MKKENFQPHRQFVRMHFRENDMDFVFQWLLGSAANGGAGIGESFYAASRIKDGDPEGWEREWNALADRVEARGEAALAAGHAVSARETLLRAALYRRAVLASLRPSESAFASAVSRMRACFRKAARLMEPPLEPVEIPFEGHVLPGWFRKAALDGRPRPTLLMLGGGETFAEDLYYFIAPAALARGYNFMTVDLPGQGILPDEGLFFRADVETPMRPVLDFALRRPEVDPGRLAAYGISAGGYMVPRAAAHDTRIKACIANAMILDMHELFQGSGATKLSSPLVRAWAGRKMPFALRMVELYLWRLGMGMERVGEYVERHRGFSLDPACISCPTLILVGEGEYRNPGSRAQQDRAMALLPDRRKRLIVGPADEGAATHCMGENAGLMSSFVFDWLDEVFAAG